LRLCRLSVYIAGVKGWTKGWTKRLAGERHPGRQDGDAMWVAWR
jgi:hypothetical protein